MAVDIGSQKSYHISERIPSGIQLVCPYCANKVIPRKGQIRRHHFSHKIETNCNPGIETLLHDGAKHFIYNSLIKERPFTLILDIASIKDKRIKKILRSLGISTIGIKSYEIIKDKYNQHFLEKFIHNVKPDVLSSNSRIDSKYFAWEVFVTHEIEERKAELFARYNIPFVEVKPIEDGKKDYIFHITNYGNIHFLSSKNIQYLGKNQRAKTSEIHDSTLTKDQVSKMVDSSLSLAGVTFPIYERNKPEDFLGDKLAPFFTIDFSDNIVEKLDQALLNSPMVYHDCHKIDFHSYTFNNAKEYNIKLNNKYQFNSPRGMLGNIYETLYESGLGKGITNNDGQIIGVQIHYPDLKTYNVIKKTIILSNEKPDSVSVPLEFATGKKSNHGIPYLTISSEYDTQERFVKSPIAQLMNILKFFDENFKLKFSTRKNKKGYPVVTNLKVIGLTNEHGLEEVFSKYRIPIILKNIKTSLQKIMTD